MAAPVPRPAARAPTPTPMRGPPRKHRGDARDHHSVNAIAGGGQRTAASGSATRIETAALAASSGLAALDTGTEECPPFVAALGGKPETRRRDQVEHTVAAVTTPDCALVGRIAHGSLTQAGPTHTYAVQPGGKGGPCQRTLGAVPRRIACGSLVSHAGCSRSSSRRDVRCNGS